MNLKDLTQEVNSALDYNPDLSAYKDQVARVLNRHYLHISSQYPWLFRQKTERLTLRADAKASTTSYIRVGEDDKTYDASNVCVFVGDESIHPTREMLGNKLVFDYTSDNRTTTRRSSAAHGTSELEFTITGIGMRYDDQYGAFGGKGDISDADSTDSTRHAGVDADEWPTGFKPNNDAGFIVLDRPIMSPSIVDTASAVGDDMQNTPTNNDDYTEASVTVKYYADWTVEYRQYYLPADCIEVLGIMDRGLKTPVFADPAGSTTITTSINTAPKKGRIIFLDAAKEEHLFLDRDSSGDPVLGIEGMPVHLDAPMVPPVVTVYNEEDWKDASSMDWTPYLKPGDTYEYCYTFIYAGVESPPSPITRVVMGTDDDYYGTKLEFQSIEGVFRRKNSRGPTRRHESDEHWFDDDDYHARVDARQDILTRITGRIIRVYRRKVMEPGDKTTLLTQGYQRFLHIGDVVTDEAAFDIGKRQSHFNKEGETAMGYPDERDRTSAGAILGWPDSRFIETGWWTYHDGELSKIKVLDESGPRQTIKVYRPPSQDMDVEIRYLSRPKRLVADADTPEWPVQYHHLLVYMALADICLQHGIKSQSQLYERKAEDLLDHMRQKYLARTNRKYIRGSFDRTVYAGERWGTPSKIG